MNDAHFHLLVNHLPITLPIVGIIIILVGLTFKSEAVKRTAYFILIIGALTSIVAMSSGEGAEEVVEKLSIDSEMQIEKHEEAAEIFSILTYLLGTLSLLALWASFKQRAYTNTICLLTLGFAFVVLFFGAQTGNTGGEIRHTEIRANNKIPDINIRQTEANDD